MTVGYEAVVVGGGIAGLMAAASLVREGWKVTVLEQARAYTEVGAGLAITPNGMSALATIGADSAVREAGHPVRLAGTTDERGAWLMRMPRDPASDGREDVYGIHRQRLHSVLLLAAEAAVFVSGARVVDVAVGAADGQRATVECVGAAGRSRFEADLVVAADGINSAVRRLLAPMTVPLFSGRSSWRGVVQDSSLVSSDFTIRWGPGTEFGAVRIRADEVYWYGYVSSEEGHRRPDEKSAAARHFHDWSDPVRSLIDRTPEGAVMRHDVYTLAPDLATYTYGRVVLIGDAAHAMLPTMGQGANTSLEDGACVGLLIGRPVNQGTPLQGALHGFDAARRPRTQLIARRSRRSAVIGSHVRAPAGVALRNTLLKAVPPGPALRAGAAFLSWRAPD